MLDSPVIILIYHRVTTLVSDPQMLAVTPKNFRAHMQYLRTNFPLLRLEEDWSKVRNPSIVVTFDDGYADNATEALPILEEVGVPATFFITTGYVGGQRELWWDDLERIILGGRAFPPSFQLDDDPYSRVWSTVSAEDRSSFYGEIHRLMKKIDPERRESWLRQLRQWIQEDEQARRSNRIITVEELQELARCQWVTIGAHSVTHTPLSSLTSVAEREEIHKSKNQLESWIGKPISVFSYPFGGTRDYTFRSVELCKETGFRKAVSNLPGQVHRWTDRYRLPRHLVRNWPINHFTEKIKGFWVA
jgi:peptidoglycan/xylan/chitin deacetylase (PgdA/CDA1 family)